jgi:hypothetical protein
MCYEADAHQPHTPIICERKNLPLIATKLENAPTFAQQTD